MTSRLLASALMCAAASAYATKTAPDPIPNAAAVLQLGNARFTVLTPRLIRLEYAGVKSAQQVGDDRATLAVINRRTPVPHFTNTLHGNTLTVTTDYLTLAYTSPSAASLKWYAGSTCSSSQNGTDQAGGARVPDAPNGVSVSSITDCCTACDSDTWCTAWVFASDTMPPSVNCWLMMDVNGTMPASNRTFGGFTAAAGFSDDNLQIVVNMGNGSSVTWTPSTSSVGNLGGTYASLDCYSNPMQCYSEYIGRMSHGLVSLDGWAVLDDTATARLDEDASSPFKGQWFNETINDFTDWYFFGHGSDYRGAVADYMLVGGNIALPPKSAFGPWWSRYYPYSEADVIQDVLGGYANFSIPLNNFVMDMDWHREPTDPTCNGWGGYDVNTTLLPNPDQFFTFLHAFNNTVGHPLKLSLNVHPQTGIDHCQLRYAQFATAMGIDPATNATVPCDMGNKTFVKTLFNIYLNAAPLQHVDWWWTDYGGCGGPANNVQLWSNHVFDSFIQDVRQTRPLVLSRYGGIGNHRYAIGFSGDTFQDISALQWEIMTTQTAANVLFAYWSHDIGGFQTGQGCPGDSTPTNLTGTEVFLRWVQFGAVAPIMRTHCDHCIRTIWSFPLFAQLRDAFYLRNLLVPYLYTEARTAFDTGVAPVHPLYYDFPFDATVHQYNATQYMFGSSVIAAPITSLVDPLTNTTAFPVYLPAGVWSNWNGTAVYHGPVVVDHVPYGYGDMPLFVNPSTILPGRTLAAAYGDFADPLVWTVFPGAASAAGVVYEDNGDSLSYMDGEFATTSATLQSQGSKVAVAIEGTSGGFAGMPSMRAHTLHWRGFAGAFPSGQPAAFCNNETVPSGTGTPGWYIVQENAHSLALPAGTLVVNCKSGTARASASIVVEVA